MLFFAIAIHPTMRKVDDIFKEEIQQAVNDGTIPEQHSHADDSRVRLFADDIGGNAPDEVVKKALPRVNAIMEKELVGMSMSWKKSALIGKNVSENTKDDLIGDLENRIRQTERDIEGLAVGRASYETDDDDEEEDGAARSPPTTEADLQTTLAKLEADLSGVRDMTISEDGGIIVGAPFGKDTYIVDTTMDKLKHYARSIGYLKTSKLQSQTRMALLKYCVNARPTYITRNVDPSLSNEGLREFDTKVDELLESILKGSIPEATRQMRGLPIHMNGLGLTRHSGPAGVAAFRRRGELVKAFTGAKDWELVTQHVDGLLQNTRYLSMGMVGDLISHNEMQIMDPIRRLRTLADSPRVKEVLDIGSIPGLSQIINDDGNTGDDESNFTDTLEVAYSTIQVAIFRNYIDEYVTRTDLLSPDVTTIEATGVFERLVEDNEYSLTKPPDILVKKLHYVLSGCYDKHDEDTNLSLSGIAFNYYGGPDGRRRMDDAVYIALLRAKLLIPSTANHRTCACTARVDLSIDPFHGLCCRVFNNGEAAYATRRSEECEHILLDFAKKRIPDVNAHYANEAEGLRDHRVGRRSAAVTANTVTVRHGNALGGTYFHDVTKSDGTTQRKEVQADIVIRTDPGNNQPARDYLFDVTIREPTAKKIVDETLLQDVYLTYLQENFKPVAHRSASVEVFDEEDAQVVHPPPSYWGCQGT